MLAWVHQATASEHEFLEGLFSVREKRRMMGSERPPVLRSKVDGQANGVELEDGALGTDEAMVAEALDKDLDGLSRPLKVRQMPRLC